MSGKAFRVFVDGQIFYHPNMSRLAITKAVINEDAENIDSFTLGVPHNHPYIDMIQPMASVIVCKKGDTVVFQGRAIDAGTDFYNTHTWTCESCLAYLKDTMQAPYEYSGTLSGLLEYFIGIHNSMVEEKKQFVMGNVTVTDSNDYVSYSNTEYSTTMDAISDKLINNYGGYLQVRYTDDLLYLDYLADFNSYSLQTVEFGKNLLDVKITYDHTERVSALIPRGAAITETDEYGNEVETGEYVDITSANGGVNYVYDQDTVDEIGWIWTTYEWSDVTLATNLLTKAKAKLAELTAGITSMDLTIVDESDTDAAIGDIRARQYVYCYSEPHGIDGTYLVLSRSRDYLNPSGNTITIGAEDVTLTGTTTKNTSNLQAQLSEIATSVKLSSSAIVSVDVEYYASSSQTELADGSWSTEAPTWESGTYIWTRTKTTSAGGVTSYSEAVCISGTDGEDGEDGLGITDITEQYYLSSSDTECIDGEWSESCPDWADGYYIWTRSHITWSDGTETDTTPVLAQTLNNLYTTTQTLTEQYSSLNQSMSEITAVVGSWTETYGVDADGNPITTITSLVSQIQSTADEISLLVQNNTWLTTEDAAELYVSKSELSITADSITSTVYGYTRKDYIVNGNFSDTTFGDGDDTTTFNAWVRRSAAYAAYTSYLDTTCMQVTTPSSGWILYQKFEMPATGDYTIKFSAACASGYESTATFKVFLIVDDTVNATEEFSLTVEPGELTSDEWAEFSFDLSTTISGEGTLYIQSVGVTNQVVYITDVQALGSATEYLSAIIQTADEIRLSAASITWESTYSAMTEDGVLTCTNADISGTVTNESDPYKVTLSGGKVQLYYDSVHYGNLAAAFWYDDSSTCGLALRLGTDGEFILFGYYNSDYLSDDDYTAAYIINFGLNPDSITQRHIFYGTAYFSSTTTFNTVVYMKSNVVFSNSYGVKAYPSDSTSAYFLIDMNSSDQVMVGNTTYDTYVRGSTLYLGNTSYATYLYGSSITVSGATTFGSVVYHNAAIYLAYNYALRLYADSDKSAYFTGIYASTYNSAVTAIVGATSYPTYIRGSILYLGNTSYATYLRGSSISVSGAITFSSAVACSSTLTVTSTATFNSSVTINSGLTVTGHLYTSNGIFMENVDSIQWANTSETDITLLQFDASNYFYVGSTSYRTYIRGSYVYLSNYLYLPNNYGIYSANSSGSYYRILYMNSSNVVYIGSTSYQTYIYGSTIYVGTAATTGNIYIGYNSAIPYIYIGINSSQYVRLSGTVTVNGSSVSSDRRLKRDIESLDDLYLKALDELRPTAYCLRDAPGKRHAGFIAQEVLEVLNDLGAENILVGDDGEGYYTLDYNAIIPILVAGYQKLKRRVDILEGST